jgi:hypothetical protein
LEEIMKLAVFVLCAALLCSAQTISIPQAGETPTPVAQSARLEAEAQAFEAYAAAEASREERLRQLRSRLERVTLSARTGGAGVLVSALGLQEFESYLKAPSASSAGLQALPDGAAAAELRENVEILEEALVQLRERRAQRGREAEAAAAALDAWLVFHERNRYIATVAASVMRSRAERVGLSEVRRGSLNSVQPSLSGSGALAEAAKRLPDMSRIPANASDKEIDRALKKLLRRQK